MSADQTKAVDRPAEPSQAEDSVAALLKSIPAESVPSTIPPAPETSFLLDSMTENEPKESVAFTWFVRVVVGLGLVGAAGVAGWLTVNSVQEFVR